MNATQAPGTQVVVTGNRLTREAAAEVIFQFITNLDSQREHDAKAKATSQAASRQAAAADGPAQVKKPTTNRKKKT